MNDIKNQRSIETITAEINMYKAQTVQNIIEIGKRLTEAKSMLNHGEWTEWLTEKVELSHRTANNFIKISQEYSNSTALTNLNYTKLTQLLALPSDEREEFIAETHTVNGKEKTVSEMSTRELDKVLKERDELKKELTEVKTSQDNIKVGYERRISNLQEKVNEQEVSAERYKQLWTDAVTQIKEYENKPIDVAVQEPSKEQLKKIKEKAKAEALEELERSAPKENTETIIAISNADTNFEDGIKGTVTNLLSLVCFMDRRKAVGKIENCVKTLHKYLRVLYEKAEELKNIDRQLDPEFYEDEFDREIEESLIEDNINNNYTLSNYDDDDYDLDL